MEHELPTQVRQLIDVLGWDKAIAYTQRFGGVRNYVPKTMTPEHAFAQVLGFELAQKLVDEFPNIGSVSMPKADSMLRHLRNTAIRTRRAAGESPRALALEYKLTETWVYLICGEPEPDATAQLDLMGG